MNSGIALASIAYIKFCSNTTGGINYFGIMVPEITTASPPFVTGEFYGPINFSADGGDLPLFIATGAVYLVFLDNNSSGTVGASQLTAFVNVSYASF